MPIPDRLPQTLQEMPPQAAHFCLEVERFLREEPGLQLTDKTIVCAFSGGLDSAVLLTTLNALAPRLGCTLLAAHLDHGLRPESHLEADHANAFCKALGVPCITGREDVVTRTSGGKGIEEAAREARYAFLSRVRNEAAADLIAQGHQLNDLAEDVLMRLTRGSGWPQLGGMRCFDPARSLLRPLLLTPRADIESQARELGLPWVEDPSNQDQAYLRNRMRQNVLPLLVQENPNFLQAVASLWRGSRQDRAFFDSEVQKRLAALPDPTFLPRPHLEELPAALRLRLYKACLEALGPGQPLAESLNRLDVSFCEGQGGKTIQFPGHKQAKLSARGIAFSVNLRARD
ncbi:MAG: tRNA lysidine(34) synthetase TilS [Proteobacteria bacterium]|nr:tRNA lysidine(34) synthetase TilS [Pseudomonadota bacterium]